MKYMNKQLSNAFIIRDELICKGDWIQTLNLLQLPNTKGISPSKVIAINNKFYISPEDVLYLMHKGELVAYLSGIGLSLQECYILMNQSKKEMRHFILYNFLSDFGYKICKYEPSLNLLRPLGEKNVNQECIKLTNVKFKPYLKSREKMQDCILWRGKTKPLSQHYDYLSGFSLSSCIVSKQISDTDEIGNLSKLCKPHFEIYPHQKHHKALSKIDSQIEVFVTDKECSLLENIIYLGHHCKNLAVVAVDLEAEIRLFSISTTSVHPIHFQVTLYALLSSFVYYS